MEKAFKFLKSAPIQNNSNDYFEFKDDIIKMMDLTFNMRHPINDSN